MAPDLFRWGVCLNGLPVPETHGPERPKLDVDLSIASAPTSKSLYEIIIYLSGCKDGGKGGP